MSVVLVNLDPRPTLGDVFFSASEGAEGVNPSFSTFPQLISFFAAPKSLPFTLLLARAPPRPTLSKSLLTRSRGVTLLHPVFVIPSSTAPVSALLPTSFSSAISPGKAKADMYALLSGHTSLSPSGACLAFNNLCPFATLIQWRSLTQIHSRGSYEDTPVIAVPFTVVKHSSDSAVKPNPDRGFSKGPASKADHSNRQHEDILGASSFCFYILHKPLAK